ncbi:jg22115 [Pararge aegeria aegeria]|uniref:Jg22115 protein n=1 Tax=Pararge aegeria aegeria TaxID=348720 RepID=A0A8S4QNP5_9NEOP|nr:jg22115 [Pararge aegeria aegeria]
MSKKPRTRLLEARRSLRLRGRDGPWDLQRWSADPCRPNSNNRHWGQTPATINQSNLPPKPLSSEHRREMDPRFHKRPTRNLRHTSHNPGPRPPWMDKKD